MPGPLDDTYTYPADENLHPTITREPSPDSYPGLDDPGMGHWTDPNSAWYMMPKPPPERNIVPLDMAMGAQGPLIPGRPMVPPEERVWPPVEPTAPVEATPPEWMPADPATQSQTTYAPEDADRNGIVTEVERWLFHQQSNPEEREQEWLEANVWSRGNTVDAATGTIIDGQTGEPLGRLPNFE